MTVDVLFEGGPLHRFVGRTELLPHKEFQFWDRRGERYLVYVRVDELVYAFDPARSKRLTGSPPAEPPMYPMYFLA